MDFSGDLNFVQWLFDNFLRYDITQLKAFYMKWPTSRHSIVVLNWMTIICVYENEHYQNVILVHVHKS